MKLLYFASIVILLVSCNKDWLDVKGDAKLTVPSTAEDFQALLDDVFYMNTNEGDKAEISSDGHYISDQNFGTAINNEKKDAYIWRKTGRHETSSTSNPWAGMYKKVLYCNIVLEGITKYLSNSNINPGTINNLKGQALFQRAYTFFTLAQQYTPPYIKENENTYLGIILKLNSDLTQLSKRSTIKETFDQIILDLTQASELLPPAPQILTRGSKGAALALLARVHLYLGNYDLSLKYSEECLKLNNTLIDYNTLSKGQTFIGLYNAEVLFHTSLSTTGPYLGNNCLIDTNLVNKYANGDLRKILFFRKNTNDNYIFTGNYSNSSTPLFSGIARDEVYLTRAECYARTGKISNAMNDLNTLLKSRWDTSIDYKPKTASTSNDALNIILEERIKFLLLRNIRWMDLRRLNLDAKWQKTLIRSIGGTEYILKPNSYQYTFPIPDDIIEITGIAQNPGW